MGNNKLLSFVIPVYNVEEYLRECVDSILYQIDDSCEIILVDDGSTDGSGDICDEYKAKSDIIKVIHKENTGVADTRNFGIKQATGKYITFVDSDDFIENGSLAKIFEWAKECSVDVCLLNGVKWYSDSKEHLIDEIFDKEQIQNKNPEDVLYYLSNADKFPGSACMKLFRRKFILNSNIYFPINRKHGEDLTFVRKAFLNAKSFDYLKIKFYKYRQERKESATHFVNDVSFFDIYKFISESVEECNSIKRAYPKKYISLMNFVAYEYCILLWQMQYVSIEKKQEAQKIVSEYEWLLNFSRMSKVKKVNLIKKLFGLKITSKILDI